MFVQGLSHFVWSYGTVFAGFAPSPCQPGAACGGREGRGRGGGGEGQIQEGKEGFGTNWCLHEATLILSCASRKKENESEVLACC